MKLTIRQFKLLQYISEFPEMTLNDYGKALNISVPTLKSEIKHMENFLNRYHVKLDVSGKNILQIWGRENLAHLLIDSRNALEFPLENQIALLLLLTDDFVVLQDIADKLFISKSKIEKSMPDILKKYPNDFQSLRHYGIRCISPEAEKRAFFVKLLGNYFKGIDLIQEVRNFHMLHFPILDYIDEDSIKLADDIITMLQENKEYTFTDGSVCQLFLCFILMINNYKSKKPRIVSDIFVNIIQDLPNSVIYMKTAGHIAKMLDITDNNSEVAYICYMLMSLRKQNVYDIQSIVNSMQEIVLKILDTINTRLSINLSQDKELVNNLSLHIYATVLRKDMLKPANIDCRFKDLCYQYPVSYEMAVITSQIIKEYYQYDVSQNEMIYLCLHFQVAIERMKTQEGKINAIVICHYGMAAATLIATKINSLFGAIEIAGCYSMYDFLQLKKHNYDLILSTEKINETGKMVIYVSPAVRENELEQILRFINNKNARNVLKLIIMEAAVLQYEQAKDVKSLLSNAIRTLVDSENVTEDYLNSVLERETISPTDIGCFAVPHGNPNFVNRTKLLIINVAKGVEWNKSNVKYIFLFAVSKEDFQKNFTPMTIFYKKLMQLNLSQEKINELEGNDLKNNLIKEMEL